MATRQVPTLPQQYQTCISRQGETNGGAWSGIVAGLVKLAHWDSNQANGEQASHAGRASDESWVDGASDAPLAAFNGWASAQYIVHRTVEWNYERTAGDLNAQVPPCRSAAPGSGDGHVLDWEHLQLLLFPSRTQQTSSGRSSEATQTNTRDGQWSD